MNGNLERGAGHSSGSALVTCLLVLSIAVVALLAYRDVLGLFFTAVDTLTLIDSSRIESWDDVIRIFTGPMMSGTSFTESQVYYRPIAVLSYSLDYSVWGLDPFGYQLTNLLLHALVSIVFFFVLRSLAWGHRVTAWLGAVVFATHPILVESVFGTARRHDIMAALFVLLSFLWFLAYLSSESQGKKTGYLILSLFSFVLGFWSKEPAIILPVLVLAYSWILLPSDDSLAGRANVARIALPYFAIAFLLVAWRTYVLGALGGIEYEYGTLEAVRYVARLVPTYFIDLIFPPYWILIPFFDPFPGRLVRTVALLLCLGVIALAFFYRRSLFGIGRGQRGKAMRVVGILISGIMIASLLGILSYPLTALHVGELTGLVTEGGAGALESRAPIVLSYLFLLLSSGVLFVGITQRHAMRGFLASPSGRSVAFLLIWLFLPLGLFVATLNFSHRNMYIAVIPFAALLSVVFVEGFERIRLPRASYRSLSTDPGFLGGVATGMLMVFLMAYSPLLRDYREWEDSGIVSSMFLHELSEVVSTLPNDVVLHIYDLPNGISEYEDKVPAVRTAGHLARHSIKSWLDLKHPGNRMKVVLHDRAPIESRPSDVDLETKPREDGVEIHVRFHVASSD